MSRPVLFWRGDRFHHSTKGIIMKNLEGRPEWMRKTPHFHSTHQSVRRRNRKHSGPYIGKGSQFYFRADERMYEGICERMRQHGQLDASQIEVQVENGEVILTGNVTNRQTKRLAEEIAESVSGVRDVHNQLQFRKRGNQPHRWVDPVGHSGVYPASEFEKAPADADAQGMASWGQGEHTEEGHDDYGEEGLQSSHQVRE